ncbi:MAG: hypothetical protein R3178_05030 [Rhodothermales bacterium]|nr:hypothetical protein [Rhodothermales bacterium]
MYQYRAFGLNIESEAPIELASPSRFGTPDARIRFGDLSELRSRHGLDGEDRRFLMDDEVAVLHWSSVGTVSVRDGKEIVVDPPSEVDLSLLGMALAGPPLGILLHQRGLLVLHASAVVVDDHVVAFIGHKGFGKSTTAAALHEAGFSLFTDDILAVDPATAQPMARPGFAQLKLWPSAAEAVFEDRAPAAEAQGDKILRPIETAYAEATLPVGAVFVLDAGDLSVDSVTGREAILEVLRNSYASRFVGTDGTPPDHLVKCTAFATAVPVLRLRRSPGLEELTNIVDLVVQTFRRMGSGDP